MADVAGSFFEHFGVKGMHWGVRRKDPSSSGPTSVEIHTTPGRKVKTSGGHNQPASEDAIRVAGHRQIAKVSTTDALATKDLQELVNRMNLEKQYASLTENDIGPGAKFVKDLAKSVVIPLAKKAAQSRAESFLQDKGMLPKAKPGQPKQGSSNVRTAFSSG